MSDTEICKHKAWQQDAAFQDGMCALCSDAIITELRRVLTALGALKGPEGWTVPCEDYDDCYHGGTPCLPGIHCKDCACRGTGRIPVPLAAHKEGGAE